MNQILFSTEHKSRRISCYISLLLPGNWSDVRVRLPTNSELEPPTVTMTRAGASGNDYLVFTYGSIVEAPIPRASVSAAKVGDRLEIVEMWHKLVFAILFIHYISFVLVYISSFNMHGGKSL